MGHPAATRKNRLESDDLRLMLAINGQHGKIGRVARRTKWRRALLGSLFVVVALSAVVVPFEMNQARAKRHAIELERKRADTEARLAALQAEFVRREQEIRDSKSNNDENQRRKLESELLRSSHVVDYAGWRNDTVIPGSNRRTPVPIDVPNPAKRSESLAPQESRRQ
jgi:hypothetical protein